jgi:hypothetical protein
MKYDGCPCCRANYLTHLGDANHHDDEGEPSRIVIEDSNNKQGQEQPTLGEPITLAQLLPSVLYRQYHHASRKLDSGYNSDVSEGDAPRSSRITNDATGEVSDGLESQLSERQHIRGWTISSKGIPNSRCHAWHHSPKC